jgi:hypothetical protein
MISDCVAPPAVPDLHPAARLSDTPLPLLRLHIELLILRHEVAVRPRIPVHGTDARPGQPVQYWIRCGSGRCRHHRGEDPHNVHRRTPTRSGSYAPSARRSPTGCSSSASATWAPCWVSTSSTTTGEDLTAHASSKHLGPTTPLPTSPQGRIKRQPILGGLINEYERARKAARERR